MLAAREQEDVGRGAGRQLERRRHAIHLETGGVLVVPPAPVLLPLLLAALGGLSVAVVLLCLILVGRAIVIPVSVTIP
ncbi:MAG: hypothetical protein ABSD56_08865, partial [Bryobacteraceae bacterium]